MIATDDLLAANFLELKMEHTDRLLIYHAKRPQLQSPAPSKQKKMVQVKIIVLSKIARLRQINIAFFSQLSVLDFI